MIYCCECKKYVHANRVTGTEVLPNYLNCQNKVYFQCPHCSNFVRSNLNNENMPIGAIQNNEVRLNRVKLTTRLSKLHETHDKFELSEYINCRIPWRYNPNNLRSVEEINTILKIIEDL